MVIKDPYSLGGVIKDIAEKAKTPPSPPSAPTIDFLGRRQALEQEIKDLEDRIYKLEQKT